MYIALNQGRRVIPRRSQLNGATALDELFDGFFPAVGRTAVPGVPANASLAARFDVVERGNVYEARIEVPGIAKDDIDVQIEGATVRVKAEPKAELKADPKADPKIEAVDASPVANEGKVLHSTRATRSWFRNFTLPSEVDEARVEATCVDGVLTLTLPKKEVAQPKRVTIR